MFYFSLLVTSVGKLSNLLILSCNNYNRDFSIYILDSVSKLFIFTEVISKQLCNGFEYEWGFEGLK
jgi:hypothetical protein